MKLSIIHGVNGDLETRKQIGEAVGGNSAKVRAINT